MWNGKKKFIFILSLLVVDFGARRVASIKWKHVFMDVATLFNLSKARVEPRERSEMSIKFGVMGNANSWQFSSAGSIFHVVKHDQNVLWSPFVSNPRLKLNQPINSTIFTFVPHLFDLCDVIMSRERDCEALGRESSEKVRHKKSTRDRSESVESLSSTPVLISEFERWKISSLRLLCLFLRLGRARWETPQVDVCHTM